MLTGSIATNACCHGLVGGSTRSATVPVVTNSRFVATSNAGEVQTPPPFPWSRSAHQVPSTVPVAPSRDTTRPGFSSQTDDSNWFAIPMYSRPFTGNTLLQMKRFAAVSASCVDQIGVPISLSNEYTLPLPPAAYTIVPATAAAPTGPIWYGAHGPLVLTPIGWDHFLCPVRASKAIKLPSIAAT